MEMWSRQLTFSMIYNIQVYEPSSNFCLEVIIAQRSLPNRNTASTIAQKNLILSSLEILDLQTTFMPFKALQNKA